MMKWILFGFVLLYVSVATGDAGCHDTNPAFCPRNHQLSKKPAFIQFMKGQCLRTCGYCSYANDACEDINPGFCSREHHLCKKEGYVKRMKKDCPKTCGYCNYASNVCEDKKPAFCSRQHHLCKKKGYVEAMKKDCPRTCKYCKQDAVENLNCFSESRPEYCFKNRWLCDNDIFKQHMKAACPITCGYCDDVVVTKECKDIFEGLCEQRSFLCEEEKYKDYMKKFCKKTCGFCSAPITKPPTTLAPGKTHPPFTGKCGHPEVKDVRVIAGTTPPRGAWPWQILLINRGFPMCGGTLVSPQWVVSAAHCVYGKERYPSTFSVRVGEHDRTKKEGSEVEVQVSKIIRHPSYNPRSLNNDISMLKLSRPVQFNKYVSPACLPSQDPPVGSKCYITGWGKTHHPGRMTMVLQQGLLPVVSNMACDRKNYPHLGIHVTKDMICGGSGGTDRISGCHGDSGGPFVCEIDGRWELHGSVSHGSPVCSSTQSYTVFSRTNYFKDWVRETMAKE